MSSDTDKKKKSPKESGDEKDEKEVLEKSTDSSKDAEEIKNDNDEEAKDKPDKIPVAIVDENNDPLNDEDKEATKDEKDPLNDSEGENNDESVEDAPSVEEEKEEDDEKNEDESEDDKKGKSEDEETGGTGTPLGEIPSIEASISRFKIDDLKILHKILFNNPGKTNLIKKNLKDFCGFEFAKDSSEYKKKLATVEKVEIKQLKSVCEMLELDKKGSKEEIAARICEFLVEPKDTEKSNSGGGKGDGRPKRSAAVKAKNRGYSSHEDFSDEESTVTSRRPQRARKGKRVNLKDESSSNESDDDKGSVYSANDDPSSEEEVPRVAPVRGRKKPASKTPTRKRSSGGRRQAKGSDESEEEESEDGSDSDAPKAKRGKPNNKSSSNNKSKSTPAKKTPAKATPVKNSKPVAKPKPAAKAASPELENDTPSGRRGQRRAAATAAAKVREAELSDEEEAPRAKGGKSSSEDEPLVKKNKTPQPPTDDEIKSYVKEILDGANLEEITMKTVCKQVYAHYPDFDLAHKKDFIKTTVKSLIST